jgi:kumamolisin
MVQRVSRYLLAVIALVSFAAIAGQAQLQPTLTRSSRDVVVNGQASVVGHLPASQSMDITLVLPLRNQASLDYVLKDIYDPSSPNYRHFFSVKDFTTVFGPSQKDYDTVTQWAKQSGFQIVGTAPNRLILQLKGSASTVEQAFHVNMNVYQHPTESRTFFAADREPMADLSVQLWSVRGLDNYATAHPMFVHRSPGETGVNPNATTGSCPSQSFCGSDMRAAYYGSGSLTGAGQTLGLFEFAGTDLADVTTYYTNAHQTNNVPITLKSVDGASTACLASQGCDDTEQTLDITQALGMAPGLNNLIVYIGKSSPLDDAGIFNAMATANPLDAQLSSSWSWTPPDPSTDDPFFQEFAMQGQNLFDAAGDSGKWTKQLTFVWPADDPYLVSVGGTDLTTTGAGGAWASETGWSDSGGGISPNNFPIPAWQTAAAAGCSSCSKTIRNGPDVAANANYTFYVCADQTSCTANLYGGTSFAAPMWAGYLALANQQAVSNGQSTLGFINPLIYPIGAGSDYGKDFHDVTSGSNGYSATVGYDLVTGWGSPNGSGLINDLTGGGGNPTFTLSANPNKIQITAGSSGTSTISTAAMGGFNSAITLSSTLKAVTFNPKVIPAPGTGTSTMTISVGSGVSAGVHTLTITGTGGGITQTTTVKIKVVAP